MKQPNILVFLTDDHGAWAMGCAGNKELHTPAMDFLAHTGARMTHAYTPGPVCSPARACFWTGRMPSQHGIHDWIQEPTRPNIRLQGEVNLAERLKAAGYQTGHFGKWHCGASWEKQPGFDDYLGENKEQYPHKGVCKFMHNGVPIEHNGHRAPFVTKKALEFLAQRDKSRPFFCFIGHVDTHSPFTQHPERLVESHAKDTFADIPKEKYVGNAARVPGKLPEAKEHRRRLEQYYAAVEMIDEQVGLVLDYLDGIGELDNTLVVYTSDHGHMNGHHGLYFKGNATQPPNFYDESIQVPCVLRWPGQIAAGTVSAAPASHCDLFQTVLGAVGVSVSGYDGPGRSYLGLLGNAVDMKWGDASFCEYGTARMIRTPKWKLVVRYAPQATGDELYDLERDPRETKSVLSDPKHAAIAAELRERLDSFFAKYTQPGRDGRELAAKTPDYFNDSKLWHG